MAHKNDFTAKFRDADGDKVKIQVKELGNGDLQVKFKGVDGDGDRVAVNMKVADLGATAQAFLSADSLHFAPLDELNDSGVSGVTLLAVNGDQLTVINAVDGVEPGKLHVQHIHGFQGAQDAVTPTAAADTDGDGFVELGEGLPFYGPIQISLDPAPTPAGDSFLFVQTFNLSGTGVTGDNLDLHEIVVHGLTVPAGPGEGTGGEVDGDNGFLAVLPVAAGEIETFDFA